MHTFGNRRTMTKTYDQDYAIDKVVSSDPNGLVPDMTTDVMGDIINASDSVGVTPVRRYAYDALYRLSGVDNASNVMQEDYDYNKTGDRTIKQFAGQAAQVYDYDLTESHHLASVAGAARKYDENGNTLTLPNVPYPAEYDDRNRLALVTQDGLGSPVGTGYIHNGKGERVGKSTARWNSTTSQIALYDEGGRLLRERLVHSCGATNRAAGRESEASTAAQPPCGWSRTVELLYVDEIPVAQITNGVISYLETDHLGTPRVAANAATNAWQWKWNFFGDAFGGNAVQSAISGGIEVSLRYPGQQFDVESGLHYNYFRDYEPGTGRYVESDPIGLGGGINTYSYADNAPTMKTDPLGLATYMCTRNLSNVPFRFGPLYHQYICVPDGKGWQTCGGLGPSGKMFDSPGVIEYEKTSSPSSCEKAADDNSCIEKCIQDEFKKPPPNYSVDLS